MENKGVAPESWVQSEREFCFSDFYLDLEGSPRVESTLAPITLSAPQLLVASQTRDKLDEGSKSSCSQRLSWPGGWIGALRWSESKCAAQRSWSSVCSNNEMLAQRPEIQVSLRRLHSTCLRSCSSRFRRSAVSTLWRSSSSSQRLLCSSFLSTLSTSSYRENRNQFRVKCFKQRMRFILLLQKRSKFRFTPSWRLDLMAAGCSLWPTGDTLSRYSAP